MASFDPHPPGGAGPVAITRIAALVTADTGPGLAAGVRSSDAYRAGRRKKPRSCDASHDGAAIATVYLPIMSNRA
jgi:hypothetical protein